MKIFQINGGVFGSTGKIMFGIADMAKMQGHEVLCASPMTTTNRYNQPKDEYIRIGSYYSRCVDVMLARITGLEGCFAPFATLRLISEMKKYKPDIIHLHSIHNSYLNIPMLFRYIKKNNIRVVWTLHDCWAFTGHCAHFDMIGCSKWREGCHSCPQYKGYPKSTFDNSAYMYRLKKKWFTGIKDMTIITPSEWLGNLVKESYLKDYPIKVINNGIDLSVFKPTESDFRIKYNCEDKFIILGVAFGWGVKKGLDVFIELAKNLGPEYQIVLVGTDETVDKQLPDNIISIHRTQNQTELAKIYTAADVFVNPTREDTYPTVNMEAIACGTPVITFDVGGSAESAGNGAIIVTKDDVKRMSEEIEKLSINNTELPLERKRLDMYNRYIEVTKIYVT